MGLARVPSQINRSSTLSLPAVTILSPRMGPDGWALGDVDPFPGAEADPIQGARHIKDIYLKVDPGYSGR